jgi:hypothetical protein
LKSGRIPLRASSSCAGERAFSLSLIPQFLNFESCGGLIVKSHRLKSKFCNFPSFLAGFALLALLLLPALANAQNNGLISGTVTDKSGAAVVGAKVVIASTGGNLTRTTETNGDGVYVASSLTPGTYNLSVSAKGFQKFEAKGVVLEVAQKARLDVTLTVGTIT